MFFSHKGANTMGLSWMNALVFKNRHSRDNYTATLGGAKSGIVSHKTAFRSLWSSECSESVQRTRISKEQEAQDSQPIN